MILFVAAAALALLLAPTRGAKVSPTASVPTAATTGGSTSEVADPWSRRDDRKDPPAVLSRQAADLAAGEVVDPWAVRPLPPPPAVTVLDAPVDPWAAPPTDPAVPVVAVAARQDDRDVVRDPWRRDPSAPPRHIAPTPPAATPASPNAPGRMRVDLKDPWAKMGGAKASAPSARSKARPSVSKPRLPARPEGDGVADPWK